MKTFWANFEAQHEKLPTTTRVDAEIMNEQEKVNAAAAAGDNVKFEGLNLLVDDAMLGTSASRLKSSFRDIPFEATPPMSNPIRYHGIRSDQRKISEDQYALIDDQVEYLRSVTAEFFKANGIKPREKKRILSTSVRSWIGRKKGGENVRPVTLSQRRIE